MSYYRHSIKESTSFLAGLTIGVIASFILILTLSFILGSNRIENNICQDVIIKNNNLSEHYSQALKRTVHELSINNRDYEVSSEYYDSLYAWTKYDDSINIIVIMDDKKDEILAIALAKNMK